MRRWLLLLLTSGVLVLALLLFTRDAGEGPVYNGRHLSEWVEVFGKIELGYLRTGPISSAGDQVISEAAQAVREAGTNAFSYLVKWLHYVGPPLRSRLPARLRRFIRTNRRLETMLTSHAELRDEGARIAFRAL